MFKATEIANSFTNLLGWKQHHDITEINLPPVLTDTETGEYYQQKHPALRLDIINSLIPSNYLLEDYLKDKVRQASIEMLNDVLQYRSINEYGKTLLNKSQLLNKYGWLNDKITNENRFVGFQILLRTGTGLQAVINEIGLQFSGVETFTLYLFHSSKEDPINTFPVTTNGNGQWDWLTLEQELNSFKTDNYNGGAFILGYYQQDINGNAINMTNFNWDIGACRSCGNSGLSEWKNISEYFVIYPIYVPQGSYVVGKMFDLNDAFYIQNQSFGLNLRLSTYCDLTYFFTQNKLLFKNLLSYKVASIILSDMNYSQQVNFIEKNIKMMITRDLEGDIESKQDNISTRYDKELKAVSFNMSGINEKCLACESNKYDPTYNVI